MFLAIICIVILAISVQWSHEFTVDPSTTNGQNFSDKKLSSLHELFLKTVFTLLGYVAKSDGVVNTQEIKRVERFMAKMELDSPHRCEAIDHFKKGAEQNFKVHNTINKFKALAKKSPNLTLTLLNKISSN
jgi:DnaJ like chaperone protein